MSACQREKKERGGERKKERPQSATYIALNANHRMAACINK